MPVSRGPLSVMASRKWSAKPHFRPQFQWRGTGPPVFIASGGPTPFFWRRRDGKRIRPGGLRQFSCPALVCSGSSPRTRSTRNAFGKAAPVLRLNARGNVSMRAFSLRDPVSTSPENALKAVRRLAWHLGEVAEWSNAPHSKCGIGASLSGVRIPPSPPSRYRTGHARRSWLCAGGGAGRGQRDAARDHGGDRPPTLKEVERYTKAASRKITANAAMAKLG